MTRLDEYKKVSIPDDSSQTETLGKQGLAVEHYKTLYTDLIRGYGTTFQLSLEPLWEEKDSIYFKISFQNKELGRVAMVPASKHLYDYVERGENQWIIGDVYIHDAKYQNQGIGEHIYFTLASYLHHEQNGVLLSSPHLTAQTKRMWEKLEKKGRARVEFEMENGQVIRRYLLPSELK